MRRHLGVPVWLLLASLALGGCGLGPKSGLGFRLPDGDAQAGQEVFVALECHACHDVYEIDLPPPDRPGPVRLELGGPVTKVQNYGALVSSIINPSHKISQRFPDQVVEKDGQSRMRVYNDTMTVQQLIDLVAFLQPQYDIVLPERSYYYP